MRRKEVNHFNTEILLGTVAIVLFILSIILISSIFHLGAGGSNTLLHGLEETLGVFAYITPAILLYFSFMLWRGQSVQMRPLFVLGGLIFTLGLFGLLSLINASLSGYLGLIISNPISSTVGKLPAFITLLGVCYVGTMLITGRKHLVAMPSFTRGNDSENTNYSVQEEAQSADNDKNQPSLFSRLGSIMNPVNALINKFSFDGVDLSKDRKLKVRDSNMQNSDDSNNQNQYISEDEDTQGQIDLRDELLGSKNKNSKNLKNKNPNQNSDEENLETREDDYEQEEIAQPKINKSKHFDMEFVAPPIELLNVDSGRSSGGDTKSKGKTIQNTLAEFGIPVEISGVTVGPTVTQFRVKTPQGFKVRDIMKYHDNLQMNLAAESIHIDAPIPGQSVVGIDVPNKDKQMLGLGTLIDTPEFKNSGNLTVAMGKDIVGKPVYGDIESMPHLLIAGATKSGKSVTIQNVITSLLYKNSPDDLKLIIIDPKKVEFTVYKNLPHLYTPVITDAKNAIKCLNWAVSEMERRYDYFAENYEGVQNINDYNNKILYPALEKERKKKNPNYDDVPEKFPYIVLIFDEFNDFMLNYGKEITSLITSLTQKARAAGMHIILATQRPDVKVINGTIKANIPARIALRTSSRIDSQTIIDQTGAEDLLGNGDMLFLNPGKKPQRVQAPYVSSDEVKDVIRYIKDRYYGYEAPIIDYTKAKDSVSGDINVGGNNFGGNNYSGSNSDDEEEQLYNNAKEYIIMTGRASATNLQSKFGLGFAKANRMIMMLEERGVVSALEGNKRKVLIGREESNSEVDPLENLF